MDVVARVERGLSRIGRLSNVTGGLVVFLFLAFPFPLQLEPGEASDLRLRSGVGLLVYMGVTLPAGRRYMRRRFFWPMVGWLGEGRAASEDERNLILRYPLQTVKLSGAFWAGAAVVFSLLNASAGIDVSVAIAVSIGLGGLTASALQYLFAERMLRPVTELALAGAAPTPQTPGVTTRLAMVWLLATGVPLLGLVTLAAGYILGADFHAADTIEASLILACLAFAIGLAALVVAAKSVADPLASMRDAAERVQRGEFEARVSVDDGSEVGLLQAGFNRMARGLGERERLRQAFGAYVDPDLAERVLAEGTDLAGEEVEVSVLFMDIRDFTSYSEGASAREVVATLNDLYGSVVPLIRKHKGHANKFIGDGLLAVFGAPERLQDHAERATAAAREIAELVREREDGITVGLGVNSGPVMAGTIGGGGRLDFTVIGDTVNTAARVESATRQTGDDVLISEATLAALGGADDEWEERVGVAMKGKRQTIRLFAPRRVGASAGLAARHDRV